MNAQFVTLLHFGNTTIYMATAGIEPAEQKVCRAYHFKIKEIIEPFVAIKGITPFGKKYIGAYQPLADTIIITL